MVSCSSISTVKSSTISPYVESFIDPLLGRSLRACRDIPAGSLIFNERAWIDWSSSSSSSASSGKHDRLLLSTVMAYLRLRDELDGFDTILKEFMFERTVVDEYEQQVQRIIETTIDRKRYPNIDFKQLMEFVGVCYTNAHAAGAKCGLFRLASQMNHSCSPNCIFYMDNVSVYNNNSAVAGAAFGCSHDDEGIFNINTASDSVQLIFMASRDIKVGEELLCSYLGECDLLLPFALRRLKLIKTKYFECQCHRCLEESGSAMYSLIEDYTPAEMKLYCDPVDRPLSPDEINQLFELILPSISDSTFASSSSSSQDMNVKSSDLNLCVFSMLRIGNTFVRMMESLPPASVQLARLNELAVISSWIFFTRLADLLHNIHPVLLIKWIHGEPIVGSLVPCWSKWIEILRDSPHLCHKPENDDVKSTEYWLHVLRECCQNPLKMDGNIRIAPTIFIRDLAAKTWDITRKIAKVGLMNFDNGAVSKQDFQYFKDCR